MLLSRHSSSGEEFDQAFQSQRVDGDGHGDPNFQKNLHPNPLNLDSRQAAVISYKTQYTVVRLEIFAPEPVHKLQVAMAELKFAIQIPLALAS
jgi:hypothetical protein